MKFLKTYLKTFIFLASFLLTSTLTKGQISQGGTPYSFQGANYRTNGTSIQLTDSIASIQMTSINQQTIDSIIQENSIGEKAYQFAYTFETDINIKTASTIDSLAVGLLYRYSVKSGDAKSINLIFSKYKLPIGAKLFLYSKNRQHLIGSFTENNNTTSERLPTIPIKGEEIIIEYFEPYHTNFEGQLTIGAVNHDFIGISTSENNSSFGTSGNCEVDINCPEGNDWQTEKKSVVRIILNGNSHCSGTLINNTQNDGTPYILTAFHCIDRFRGIFGFSGSDGTLSNKDKNRVSDFVFIFNYESPSCNGVDGSISQSISSSTFRSASFDSDFALLELSKKPFASYNPVYAGWNRNDNQGAGGVGIHHPKGDVKKISTFNMSPINSDCIDGGHTQSKFYLINNWQQTANGHGVTEGGSSGSPLFNNSHQVIGQLFGGCPNHNDNCNDPTNDFSNYGKVFSSWEASSNSDEQLKVWLDPNNSGALTLSQKEGCPSGTALNLNITHTITSGLVEIYRAKNDIIASNTIQSGATVTYEAGHTITLEPGFEAEQGSIFTAQIKDYDCIILCDPIDLTAWTSFVVANGDLCYNVSNATNFSVTIHSVSGALVNQNSGTISGNSVCVWNTNGFAAGTYLVTASLSNSCETLSNSYQMLLSSGNRVANNDTINSSISTTNNYSPKEINQQIESKTFPFTVNVFPNPNSGFFTLEVYNSKPYSIEIINSLGAQLYKVEHLNTRKININQTGLSIGVYYIRILHGNDIVFKKLVIQQ